MGFVVCSFPKRSTSVNQQLAKKILLRLLKNTQMQVELCEIPPAGAPEILRSEAYLGVRRNDER